MGYSPCIIFITAAVKSDMDAIWAAMGRGQGAFSRKCCPIDPEATWETPATHYMMQDESATVEDEVIWRALVSNQDLPELPPGVVWGEEEVITAAAAMAAATEANVDIFSHIGSFTSERSRVWRNKCFETMDLQFVPDEPL